MSFPEIALRLINAQREAVARGEPLGTKPILREILNESRFTLATTAELRAVAKNVHPKPSHAQRESGNYPKGHVSWKGIPITIEVAKGGYRRGISKDGVEWEQRIPRAHYGYVKRTQSAADGDNVDCFLCDGTGPGEHLDSEVVFVVNQMRLNGDFDEHKCVFGCASMQAAKDVYQSSYKPGWKGCGSITAMTVPQFKAWLAGGDTSRPIMTLATEQPEQPSKPTHGDHDAMLIAYLDALIDAEAGDPHSHELADELHGMLAGHQNEGAPADPKTVKMLATLPAEVTNVVFLATQWRKLAPGDKSPVSGRVIKSSNAWYDEANHRLVYADAASRQQKQQQAQPGQPTGQTPQQPHEKRAAALADKIVGHIQNPQSPAPSQDDYNELVNLAPKLPQAQRVDIRNKLLESFGEGAAHKEMLANALRDHIKQRIAKMGLDSTDKIVGASGSVLGEDNVRIHRQSGKVERLGPTEEAVLTPEDLRKAAGRIAKANTDEERAAARQDYATIAKHAQEQQGLQPPESATVKQYQPGMQPPSAVQAPEQKQVKLPWQMTADEFKKSGAKIFKTAAGSMYAVNPQNGSTIRIKSDHTQSGHDTKDVGIKDPSAKTVYVPNNMASALSNSGVTAPDGKPPKSRVILKDGKATLLTWNDKAGKWGATTSGRDVAVHDKPGVGLQPLELWSKRDDIPGHEAYSGVHAGNAITSIEDPTDEHHKVFVDAAKLAGKSTPAAQPPTEGFQDFPVDGKTRKEEMRAPPPPPPPTGPSADAVVHAAERVTKAKTPEEQKAAIDDLEHIRQAHHAGKQDTRVNADLDAFMDEPVPQAQLDEIKARNERQGSVPAAAQKQEPTPSPPPPIPNQNTPNLDHKPELGVRPDQPETKPTVPGHPAGPAIHGTPQTEHINHGRAYNVPTESLHVDPHRFQYKIKDIGKDGVTGELKGVNYNPMFGGIMHVWRDPADGKDYVVNGHHRYELAARSKHPNLNVQYLKAKDAVEARSLGALVNIAEGHGTSLDAAKYLRDSGLTPQELKEKHNVSLKGKVAADAAVLSKLSGPLFHKLAVEDPDFDLDRALAIGKHLGDDEAAQSQLFNFIQKEESKGKELSPKLVERMALKLKESPRIEGPGESLFGDAEDESTFVAQAELENKIRGEFVKQARHFEAIKSEKRAEATAGAGNVLNTDRNKEEHRKASEVVYNFDALSNKKGEIADILKEEGAKYARAKTAKQREDVAKSAGERLRGYLLRQSGSAVEADSGAEGPPRPASDGAGGASGIVPQGNDRGPGVDTGRKEGDGDGVDYSALSKEQMKELAKSMPVPESLPEKHDDYFKPVAGQQVVPLDKIRNLRARPEGIENASKFMEISRRGGPKREPIKVVKEDDGSFTVADGNSTFANAKKNGWSSLPVQVVSREWMQEQQPMPLLPEIFARPVQSERADGSIVHGDVLIRRPKESKPGEVEAEPVTLATGFDESKHPRGQPENAGEFAEKGKAAIPRIYGVWNDEVGDDRYAKRVIQSDQISEKVIKRKLSEVEPGEEWPFPPIIVKRESGPYELKDGHHRVEVAKRLGMTVIPAVLFDTKAFGHPRPVNTFVEIDADGETKVIQPNNESLPPIKVMVSNPA